MSINQSEKPNYFIVAGSGIFLFLAYYIYEIYFERNIEALSGQTLLERAFLLGLCSSVIFGFFEYVLKRIFFSPTVEGFTAWYTGQIMASGIVSYYIVNYFEVFPEWEVTDMLIFISIFGATMVPPVIIAHYLFNKALSRGFNEDLSYIIIKSPKSIDELVVDPREILFIMEEDSAIRVFYMGNEEILFKLIELKLSNFEKQFSDITFLTRCHPAYLINIERISEVVREKQQLFIHFSSQYIIPVEDKYRNKVLESISR